MHEQVLNWSASLAMESMQNMYIAQMLKSINCITKRNVSHALPLNFIECKQQHKSTNTLPTIELTDTNSSELRRILSTDILQSIVNATFKICAFFLFNFLSWDAISILHVLTKSTSQFEIEWMTFN